MAAQNLQERYKTTLRISWIFVNMMCPITFVLQLTMVSSRSFISTDKLCFCSVFFTLSGKSHGRCAFSHFLQISGVASGTKWLLKDIKQNWNEELICCNELRSGSVHSILRQQNYLSNFLMPRMIRWWWYLTWWMAKVILSSTERSGLIIQFHELLDFSRNVLFIYCAANLHVNMSSDRDFLANNRFVLCT